MEIKAFTPFQFMTNNLVEKFAQKGTLKTTEVVDQEVFSLGDLLM